MLYSGFNIVLLLQVFFDLMREIRARKKEDVKGANGKGKDKGRRKKLKCNIV